jgi:hypothetical protein
MAEKISVQIGLEGAEEVERQLADIGKTGQQALQDLAKGAESLEQVSQASEQAAAGLEKTGEAATQAGQSFLQVTEQAAKSGQEVVKLVGEIAKYGVEIALIIQHHKGWISQLIQLAGSASSAARAIGLLGPAIGTVGAAFVAAGATFTAAAVGLEAVEKAATKFAASDEKLNNSLQTLSKNTGQAFDELQRGKAVLEQLGVSGDRFGGIATKVNETADKTKIATVEFTNLGTAIQKSSDNALQSLLKLITTVDRAGAIQAGAKVGFTEEDVDRIRRLNAAGVSVEEIFKRIQATGPLISPEASANFDKMHDGVLKVNSAWARLEQAWKSTVFTSLAAQISATFNNAEASVLNFAAATLETINNLVNQISAAFQKLGQSDIGKGIRDTIQQAVSGLNTIIAEAIGGAMAGVGFDTSSIQAVKNEIMGVAQATQTAAQATNMATVAFDSFGKSTQTAAQATNVATVAFDGFGRSSQAAGQETSKFNSVLAGITWDVISSAGVAAWNALTSAIQNTINKLLEYIGLKEKSGSGGGSSAGAPGKARGGLIGGRGTGTSDSNLAWLSRGEFVIRAAAVRQFGAGLFAALNAGSIPGYAEGGLVLPHEKINRTISILEGAEGSTRRLQDSINSLMNSVLQSLNGIIESINNAGGPFNKGMETIVQAIVQAANSLQGLSASPGKAYGGLIGGRGSGTSDSNLAWLSRGEFVVRAAAVRKYGAGLFAALNAQRFAGGGLVVGGGGTSTITGSGIEAIVTAIETNTQAIESQSAVIMELAQIIGSLAQTTVKQSETVVDTMKIEQQKLRIEMKNAFGMFWHGFEQAVMFPSSPGPSGFVPGTLARGGMIGGRGTGTSDSNLAWLSRGEHIMPARVVAQPGVLAFLEALRRSGGNLRRVLDGMGRFALGGLVPRPALAFAGGGPVGGMSNVTINFPGTPPISGLRASDAVVDELRKAAALAQVRSGGRKPSRYS